MDNASKALILSGALLIAALIVSLGIAMFNSASSVVETTESSIATGTIAQFNAQFEKHFGKNKSREQAKALARLVAISNANGDNPTISCPPATDFDSVSASTTYNISGKYGSGGYLTTIVFD